MMMMMMGPYNNTAGEAEEMNLSIAPNIGTTNQQQRDAQLAGANVLICERCPAWARKG